ncbi:MAG: hypothetical protein ACREOI_25910 [bacterium]
MQDHAGESSGANLFDRHPAASLGFGIVEILRSARHAISLRLLAIQIAAYAPAYAIYFLLTCLSWLLAGRAPASVWAEWGLLPCFFVGEQPRPLWSWMVYGLGLAALAIAFLASNAAGSHLLWMKWRGQYACSVREAFDFAFAKMSAIVMAPAAIFFVIALFAGGGWLIGMLGRIPYLGELLVTGFAWLWMLAALVLLLMIAAAALALIMAPAIVAITEANAVEAIFQTASIFWRRPWRLLLYLAGVVAVAIAGLIVSAFLVTCAFLVMDALFANAMGAGYQKLSSQAQYLLQSWSVATRKLLAFAPGLASPFLFPHHDVTPLALTPWFDVLAHILALSLLFTAVWVLAYPLAIINSGLAATFLLLRQALEGERPFGGEKNFNGENSLERYQADEPTSP